MKNKQYLERHQNMLVPTYGPQVVLDRGQGSRVWDIEGREYIDLAGGIAVTGLGHCHPEVTKTLQEQAGKIWHLSNVFANVPSIELAQKLTDASFAEQVFFTNSGAEANEAALKLARRFAFDRFSEEKSEIITFTNSFHGRTLFTVTVGGQEKYRTGFGPLPGGITYAPYNNPEAFKKIISAKTCAVIVEPIQGEGGIINASKEFMQGVRDLCNQFDALLIFDEIQTGMGRTGDLFAYQGLGVTPDIITLAKALGGGFPIGAMLTLKKIAAVFSGGVHGSTYGGNPLATGVANTVFDLINNEKLLRGVLKKRQLIEQFFQELSAEFDIFEPLRGKGLLVGIPLKKRWHGKAKLFLKAGLEEGVIALVAGLDVVRFAPSLIIPDDDLQKGLAAFKRGVQKLVTS